MACGFAKPSSGTVVSSSFFCSTWVFRKIGVPQNGWFIMKTLWKWMIWRYPYFFETPTVLILEVCQARLVQRLSTNGLWRPRFDEYGFGSGLIPSLRQFCFRKCFLSFMGTARARKWVTQGPSNVPSERHGMLPPITLDIEANENDRIESPHHLHWMGNINKSIDLVFVGHSNFSKKNWHIKRHYLSIPENEQYNWHVSSLSLKSLSFFDGLGSLELQIAPGFSSDMPLIGSPSTVLSTCKLATGSFQVSRAVADILRTGHTKPWGSHTRPTETVTEWWLPKITGKHRRAKKTHWPS